MSFSGKPATVYNYEVESIDGEAVKMSAFKGKVLLIVNVASKCGLTPQYKDLQAIYSEFKEEGLEVLGFPANNFMYQEPGTNTKIKAFCTSKFNVTFPMFSKISVKGKKQHPLYQFLTKKDKNGKFDAPVKWNFQKYLVGRDGQVIDWIAPGDKVTDKKVRAKIKKALKQS